jgi:DNA-binding MarR family transcriptional regulator
LEPSKQQLTERFVQLMELVRQEVMRSASLEEWSDLELTMPQCRALALLPQGPQRMGNIAAYLGSSLSSATSMIDRLVDKGLVERLSDPDDRRVVLCQLTVRGQEEIERFWRIGRLGIARLTEHLTTDELEKVVQAIELLYQATQRSPGTSPGKGQ